MTRRSKLRVIIALPIVVLSSGCTLGSHQKGSASVSDTSEIPVDCVSRHVKEAIELNTQREPLYARVSNNRSLAVSQELMKMERKMLRSLPLLELPAQLYQKKGIPILCLDVVSMRDTPAFIERLDPPEVPRVPFNGLNLSLELMALRLRGDQKGVEEKLQAALEVLNKGQRFNCLARHFVESILRSVRLAPHYRSMSRERGMMEPNLIIGTYINSQIETLGAASELDSMAAPLQAEGIPIICNDVPAIPVDVNIP
jgi:hypothetical protein